jgi:TonB family protein
MKGETPRAGSEDPEAVVHPRLAEPPKLKGIPDQVLAGLTAEQAARAARSAGGGGDEGGGYDRDGGFVDSGPLSFDTAGYDWGAYAAEMIRRIKRNWDIPALAHYGIKGRLTIRFFILKDGRVEAERILSSSGIPPYDNASFQAIAVSSPFRPLPADLGHDREGVTITFFYNIRPEDLEEARRPDPRKR